MILVSISFFIQFFYQIQNFFVCLLSRKNVFYLILYRVSDPKHISIYDFDLRHYVLGEHVDLLIRVVSILYWLGLSRLLYVSSILYWLGFHFLGKHVDLLFVVDASMCRNILIGGLLDYLVFPNCVVCILIVCWRTCGVYSFWFPGCVFSPIFGFTIHSG